MKRRLYFKPANVNEANSVEACLKSFGINKSDESIYEKGMFLFISSKQKEYCFGKTNNKNNVQIGITKIINGDFTFPFTPIKFGTIAGYESYIYKEHIKVGCQIITFKRIQELNIAIEKAIKIFEEES